MNEIHLIWVDILAEYNYFGSWINPSHIVSLNRNWETFKGVDVFDYYFVLVDGRKGKMTENCFQETFGIFESK